MFDFYNFIRKKWSEYSLASGQKGTVIDELAVKPTGLVLRDFYNVLVDQQVVNNISQWENMTDDQLDFFGNKFFLPRIDGDYAFGTLRIWFDEKKDIDITTSFRAVTPDGYRFIATQPGHVSRNTFKTSTDRYALYYIDILIIGESKGNIYNVEAGEISQLTDIDFTYKMTTNPDAIENGSRYETNEEYYNRLIYSINDRSMMNKRSMFVKLPELFPVISSMHIAGPGDRYMTRDLVSATDVSLPIQKADFLGKINGENIIKHIAFHGIYPPEPGSAQKLFWGPFSIPTDYRYPLTIEPSDITSQEPAFHGYQLDQECTNEMYRGLFFDDYKTFMEVATTDLFNIQDEEVGFESVVVPSPDWVYGAQGMKRGNMGELYEDVKDIDVLNFNNNDITIAGGAKNSISVGKDIQKRIGVKVSGTLTFPTVTDPDLAPSKSNLQIMVGSVNGEDVDGFSGIGFGVRLIDAYEEWETSVDNKNAIIYMAHEDTYGQMDVFATSGDTSGITSLGAIVEQLWRIEQDIEYDFEFIIHDDLRMTLYLEKTAHLYDSETGEVENKLHLSLASTYLNVYSEELKSLTTDRYGTTMTVALTTDSENVTDKWVISNLKAFDTQQSRATALYAVNMTDIESPVSVELRAFGSGSVDNSLSDGYSAYIWDKETFTTASGSTELTSGGWSELGDISNPTGSKDVLTALLSHRIQNLDRYLVNSRYGTNVFIMIAASGTSKMNSTFFNNIEDDIQSKIQVDYLKIESETLNQYHANNKADIFVSTIKNTEDLEIASVVIDKTANENFFELNEINGVKMPIADIVSVTLGTAVDETEPLSDSEYQVVRPSSTLQRSSQETVRIILDNSTDDTITVEYTTYPEVARIQEFFDGNDFGKLYGDILVKHKEPVELTFTVYYTSDITEDQLIDEIKKYVDDNIDGTFSTKELISYLYNEEFVNNVQEPISIAYTRKDDDGNEVNGTFTDTLTIRDVDFFRIADLTVSKL